MLMAKDEFNKLIKPTRDIKAYCPYCNGDMQTKCGKIIIWHWAHKTHDENCIYKPETQWHLKWKTHAQDANCEVEHRIENNITDVVISNTRVLELQHSGITAEEINNRCIAYRKNGMYTDWLFDMRDKYQMDQLNLTKRDKYYTFVQKWKKSTINALFDENGKNIHGKVWFDFGEIGYVFLVKKLYDSGNGWGYIKPMFDVFYPIPQRWW